MSKWAMWAAMVAALACAAPAQAREGGSVSFLSEADVDYIDPGQSYYTFGFMVQYAVNRTLYGFRPGSIDAVPDLAAGAPEIAADRRSLTVRLRPGVRYAPPVNREVTSADVKYAFERAFSRAVPSGYATSYFSEIVGAPSGTGRIAAIPGIETPDPLTLVFRLDRPVAQRVAAALVLPITAPVPREYAARFDAQSPSTYNEHVAFTGPYMVRNDSAGRLVGYRPGRSIELVRNPSWDRATDFRPAHLDAITVEEATSDDIDAATTRTLGGSRLLCCDASPSARVLRDALASRPAQVGRISGGGTRWIALNTRMKPFDDADVRRAAVAGVNRVRLRRARGGALEGPVAQHYLPPGIPGHDESGGTRGFEDLDFMAKPSGSRALAAKYFRRAGFRRGRYTGAKPLLMIGANADPGAALARAARRELERLGFRIRLRLVSQDTLYTKFCGVPRARVPICANVGWFRDFNDPESLLSSTFSGDAIRSFGNVNWSRLRVPAIDRLMRSAAELQFGPARNTAWADVNHAVARAAPGIPYVWDDEFQTASADVDAVMSPYTSTWDLSFTQIR